MNTYSHGSEARSTQYRGTHSGNHPGIPSAEHSTRCSYKDLSHMGPLKGINVRNLIIVHDYRDFSHCEEPFLKVWNTVKRCEYIPDVLFVCNFPKTEISWYMMKQLRNVLGILRTSSTILERLRECLINDRKLRMSFERLFDDLRKMVEYSGKSLTERSRSSREACLLREEFEI